MFKLLYIYCKNIFDADYGFLTFVLPWQVFQELDHIKKQNDQLGFRAREATRWMLDKFASKHPRLKGQPMTNKGGGSNDDAILKCAIYLQSRVNHIVSYFIFLQFVINKYS